MKKNLKKEYHQESEVMIFSRVGNAFFFKVSPTSSSLIAESRFPMRYNGRRNGAHACFKIDGFDSRTGPSVWVLKSTVVTLRWLKELYCNLSRISWDCIGQEQITVDEAAIVTGGLKERQFRFILNA